MKRLESAPENEEANRHAAPYIWGAVALAALLVLVIVGAGYLLSQR